MDKSYDLIRQIQKYVAVTSADATVLWGQPAGSVKVAAEFLSNLNLSQFRTDDGAVFRRCLNTTTTRLMKRFPKDGRYWGVARKVLNIFLHNAFYNHYLRVEFGLERAERLFEVPIDSAVARGLKKRFRRGSLPPWNGVRHLTADENGRYQEHACSVAGRYGINRVHLDVVLWLEER